MILLWLFQSEGGSFAEIYWYSRKYFKLLGSDQFEIRGQSDRFVQFDPNN